MLQFNDLFVLTSQTATNTPAKAPATTSKGSEIQKV